MPLHFTPEELKSRRDQATAQLQANDLAALLIFRQESMYYLTGYDTTGYSQFQCLYLGADGQLILLTRSADLRQARLTSIIDDIRLWHDDAHSNPAQDLWRILEQQNLRRQRIGIELEAYCLTARRWEHLRAALQGNCHWQDESHLISRLRLIKSPAELTYIRQAAQLADHALTAARQTAQPGAPEQDILAAMQTAVFRGGGDYPASRFIIGSGPNALMVRNFTGYRTLDQNDQLQLEFAGAYRHYHACLMRTILTGQPTPQHRRMHQACAQALQACKDACRPGATFGDLYQAHAQTLDQAGYSQHKLNACGYSLGALYPPTWMDWPMIYANNPTPIQPNMTIFMHMILLDWPNQLAMSLGDTIITTPTAPETLTTHPPTLLTTP